MAMWRISKLKDRTYSVEVVVDDDDFEDYCCI